MSVHSEGDGAGLPDATRVVGRYCGAAPGPTLICIACLHGNEPAGVVALRRLFAWLSAAKPPFRGECIGLIGNVGAAIRGVRHIEEDLNRVWSARRIEALRAGTLAGPEAAEQAELLEHIVAALDRSAGRACLLDLHTTSGSAAPFLIITDTPDNRSLAERLPVPVVFGLIGQIGGTLTDYAGTLRAAAVAFEAGRHDDPGSVERHEAAALLALHAAGNLVEEQLPEIDAARLTLGRASAAIPRFLDVRYRHAIQDTDGFAMRPGFASFQAIEAGQLLARDRNGDIVAPVGGRVLLPLYQPLGSDGFFIVQPV